MFLEFIKTNFMTLMILWGLIAVILMNRKSKLPGSELFFLGIILLFVVIAADSINNFTSEGLIHLSDRSLVTIKTISATTSYILRPFIIFTELLIILPDKNYKALFAIPAAINAVIFSTAFTGGELAFHYDESLFWHGGPLGISIYISQIFYVLVVAVYSAKYFQGSDYKRSIIILTIILQTLIVAVVEYENILTGYSNEITALCMFEYYAYLCVIYQREMREAIAERET